MALNWKFTCGRPAGVVAEEGMPFLQIRAGETVRVTVQSDYSLQMLVF